MVLHFLRFTKIKNRIVSIVWFDKVLTTDYSGGYETRMTNLSLTVVQDLGLSDFRHLFWKTSISWSLRSEDLFFKRGL